MDMWRWQQANPQGFDGNGQEMESEIAVEATTANLIRRLSLAKVM